MSTAAHRRHLERARESLVHALGEAAQAMPVEIGRRTGADLALRSLRAEVADTFARFHPAFTSSFAAALERAAEGASRPRGEMRFDLDALEIMDDQRVQEEIEVVQAAQALSDEASAPLHRLLRLESMLRAETAQRTQASPAGPAAIGRALWQASERLPLSLAGRSEAVRGTVRLLAPRLGPIYDALVAQAETEAGVSVALGGVQAASARTAPSAAGAAAAAAGSPRRRGTDAAARAAAPVVAAGRDDGRDAGDEDDDEDDEDEDSHFDVTRPGALQELLDTSGARGVDVEFDQLQSEIAPTQPMPLDGDDLRVPELIHRHRDALAALDGTPAPGAAQALITRIFGEILGDPALPADAVLWVGRLAPAVVQLAATDPELLRTHRHPAWTFVNRLVMLLAEHPSSRPPEFAKWVQAVSGAVLAEPTSARFEEACRRLAHWRTEQARRRLTSVEPALDLLRRNAALEPQVEAARLRLGRRLDAAGAGQTVRRFVLTVWSLECAQEALAAKPAPRGEPDAWDVATDLIWSTSSARSRADSPTLMPLIPPLVERLRTGMARVGLGAEHRDAWLDRLAALHVKAMQRRPEDADVDAPLTIDLKLEDAAPSAFGDDVARAAEAAGGAVSGPGVDALAALEVGDVLAMRVDDVWTDVQLLWMSENGHFLLFASPGGASHSVTRRALGRMLAEGLVRTAEGRSALQRATQRISRLRS
jgi:hypothetical protein